MPRERMEKANGGEKSPPTNFFATQSEDVEFFSSGCHILDRAIGGGWALGRIGNIVGDEATGKTLLAIEACNNFIRRFPKGKIYYRESEAAFDLSYAEALGMPVERVDFKKIDTVEDFFRDLDKVLDELTRSKQPGLYALDSLDACSDEAEQDRDITKAAPPAVKARKMSEIFRKLAGDIERTRLHLMIINQVRSKIGVTFGTTKFRAGGKALDFYSSQTIWLSKIKTLVKQQEKIERPTGVQIRARCTKLKVGLPFREATFDILFGFGIDDVTACINWLKDSNREKLLGNDPAKFFKSLEMLRGEDYRNAVDDLHDAVTKAWGEIETSFLPEKSKYARLDE
jgi:recombination protein RecA